MRFQDFRLFSQRKADQDGLRGEGLARIDASQRGRSSRRAVFLPGRRRRRFAERKKTKTVGHCQLFSFVFALLPSARWPRSRPLRRPCTTSCTPAAAWAHHPPPPLSSTGTTWASSSGTSARTTGRRSASASASGSRSSARRGEFLERSAFLSLSTLRFLSRL